MDLLKFLTSVRLTCWSWPGVAVVCGLGLMTPACSSAKRPPDGPPRVPATSPATAAPAEPLRPDAALPSAGGTTAPRKVLPARDPDSPAGSAGEWRGVVRSGVMAAGGETTGVTLTTATAVYELRATGATRDALQAANGTQVTVRGVRRDVESVESRRVRRLIEVTDVVTP